jgi:hypothetical protein
MIISTANQEWRTVNDTSTQSQARPAPAPLPIPAEDPKTLLERVQALFAKFVKGKTAEVDPRLIEVREYAAAAIKYWETQRRIATFELQRQMGDAESGTVNGVPVIKRYQPEVKGFWTEPRSDDYLKGVKH